MFLLFMGGGELPEGRGASMTVQWLIFVFVVIPILYFIYRNKDKKDK
jgi:hypothetical protein